jgi:hypothetical protein
VLGAADVPLEVVVVVPVVVVDVPVVPGVVTATGCGTNSSIVSAA